MSPDLITEASKTEAPPRGVRPVRCRCRVCGSHAYARPGVPLSGSCGNCHNFDLEPIEEVERPELHAGRITRGGLKRPE